MDTRSSDPRERLMALGQQILDLTYEIDVMGDQLNMDRERVRDHLVSLGLVRDNEVVAQISKDTPSPPGLDLLDFAKRNMRFMEIQSERHHTTIEYCALRRALEYTPAQVEKEIADLLSEVEASIEAERAAKAEEGKDK